MASLGTIYLGSYNIGRPSKQQCNKNYTPNRCQAELKLKTEKQGSEHTHVVVQRREEKRKKKKLKIISPCIYTKNGIIIR